MKKTMLSLIAIIMIVFICFSGDAYATGNIADDADGFIKIGKNEYEANKPIDEGALQITSNEIYNLLFTIAVVIAFGVGLVIGIQFITGSVDEKAKIKETLVPYVVGCVVIFAAFTIWKIVMELGNTVENTASTSNIVTVANEKNIDIISS